MFYHKVKKVSLVLAQLLLISCNGGGGGSSPNPGSITSTATVINGNNGMDTKSIAVAAIMFGSNGIINILGGASGQIWQTPIKNINWNMLPILPLVDSAQSLSAMAINLGGSVYVASASGNVYHYSNNAWVLDNKIIQDNEPKSDLSSGTEDSIPRAMILTGANDIYLGNEAGHIWYYDATNNLGFVQIMGNGFSTAKPITQLILDNQNAPKFLGVATGANIWLCKLISNPNNKCSKWVNLVNVAGNTYTDAGTKINAISFYQTSDGRYDYGYIGNEKGHVWRAIYDTVAASVVSKSIINMNTEFPGFPSNAGVITSIIADNNNSLYVGTATGQILLWTTKTLAWNNITPKGSSTSITALTSVSSDQIIAGNSDGVIWTINWQ